MSNPWITLSLSMFEAQQVMWLRGMKIMAGGPAANREAMMMVTEKIEAGMEAAGQMALGASSEAVMRGYRRKVRANRSRLMRSR